MKMKKIKLLAVAMISLMASVNVSAETVSGAGATFPQPFYNAAFVKYGALTGVKVSYGGIGSGGGIRSLKDRIVDFGASDAFLSNKEMGEMPAHVVHIPTCSGAVVVAFNLPGIKSIKLTPAVLVDVFAGKVNNWNSVELKKLNPGVRFPNEKITVVYRSDGSGTTNMFTDYLTKVSTFWASKYGSGKTVNWPTGIAAKGNPGVAGTISQTRGAIGYIGSEYAFAQHIPSAMIQNKAGKFIKASVASTSAAGKGKIPGDTRVMLNNSSAPGAYPIAGFTWILIYKEQNYNSRFIEQARATLKLLDWMVSKGGQSFATKTNYAPLPNGIAAHCKKLLRTITYNGKPILK